MVIYTEGEEVLSEIVLRKMTEGAKICLNEEDIDLDRVEISLTLVDKDEIKELNCQYRNKDKVTDVLSFPQFEYVEDLKEFTAEGEPIVLGDVVICEEVAREQAEEYGHSLERELVYLFVHSILHLLGYDHEVDEEKVEMRTFEKRVMSQLELGDF